MMLGLLYLKEISTFIVFKNVSFKQKLSLVFVYIRRGFPIVMSL